MFKIFAFHSWKWRQQKCGIYEGRRKRLAACKAKVQREKSVKMPTNWKRLSRKLDLESVCDFVPPAEGKLTPAWDDIKSESKSYL